MKALSLLFFIFLVLNLSKESDISDALIDSIYDYLPDIIRGISSSEATKCPNELIQKKSKILPLLQDVISDLIDGASLVDIAKGYTIRAGFIFGLDDNCSLLSLGLFLADIDSANGIEKIGKAIQENNKKIYDLERDIKKEESFENKLYYFGKILYYVLNFYFK